MKYIYLAVFSAALFAFVAVNTYLNRYDVVAFGDTYDFIVFNKLNGRATLYEMYEDRGEKTYEPRELNTDLYLRFKKSGI
jgi:hypothetical protein